MHDRPPARRRRPRTDPRIRRRLDRAAANRRTYRARLKAGGASLKAVPVTDIVALIEALIELRWLDENKSEDRAALVAAVGALLDDIASRHRCR